MTSRIIIWPDWHPTVFAKKISFHHLIWGSPAGTSGKNNRRRLAYAQALQYWAKRANLPMLGWPCLLAGSVLELQRVMELYISFSNDIVPGSVALLEGFFGNQTPVSTDAPSTLWHSTWRSSHTHWQAPQGVYTSRVPCEKWVKMEAPPNQFPGWEKVLHPSWLAATAGQAPPECENMKWRHCHQSSEVRRAWCQRAEEQLQAELAKRNSPSPEPLELMHVVDPPPGFEGVTAFLWGDPSPAATFKIPLEFTQPGVAIKPTVATLYTSHVIQDEVSGVTYMETVTTSVGQVALRHIHPVTQNPQLTIEDITDLPKIEGNNDRL